MVKRTMVIMAAVLIGAIATMALLGCDSKKEDNKAEEAGELYSKNVTLLKQYTDSLKQAKDSADVLRLEKEYDGAMTRLGLEFPADTHLGISEGENDTLCNLTQRYIEIRDSLLYRFAHPFVETDSVAEEKDLQES